MGPPVPQVHVTFLGPRDKFWTIDLISLSPFWVNVEIGRSLTITRIISTPILCSAEHVNYGAPHARDTRHGYPA